ncbi:hypothetical protein A2164_02340, partial [Candidatus Curtissbacteria bacterium RBG_13_35_7]
MKQISDLGINGKTVLLRADLDIPLTNIGSEDAASRLRNLKPSIDYLFSENAHIIIIGHIDRPQTANPALSTRQLLDPLQKILKRTVVFKADFGEKPVDIPELGSQITLFENLRFWPGEMANDGEFATKLAQMAQAYVNDAFGNCHREHASMVGVPKLLPSAGGFHLESEVNELTAIIRAPKHPFVAIVGGAKIATKLPVIENLAKIADYILVGGMLPIDIAKNQVRLPDNVIVGKLTEDNRDLSSESVEKFKEVIKTARLVVWNGPLGLYEQGYNHGTL